MHAPINRKTLTAEPDQIKNIGNRKHVLAARQLVQTEPLSSIASAPVPQETMNSQPLTISTISLIDARPLPVQLSALICQPSPSTLPACPLPPSASPAAPAASPASQNSNATWSTACSKDISRPGDPGARARLLDCDGYLEWVEKLQFNYLRGWIIWSTGSGTAAPPNKAASPMPFLRAGPGSAHDGKPRFDLFRFDETFFQLLRAQARTLQERGVDESDEVYERISVGAPYSLTARMLSAIKHFK